jgi:quercetin dioxygenase-like cupin family protein
VARIFPKELLPHLRSTRDTRDRLDLVTENVPVGARSLRVDRIRYHPGDTAAAHYHTDCHHVFYVLEGEGVLHADEGHHRLSAGMVAVVGPGEVHGSTTTPVRTSRSWSSGRRRRGRPFGSTPTTPERGRPRPEVRPLEDRSEAALRRGDG